MYNLAIEVLKQAASPRGFLASVSTVDNYDRVWTRDGVITSLAALLSGDESLIQSAKSTIETIFEHQHQVGFFPSNVAKNGSISYGGIVGRVDNVTWAIIGICQYARMTGDFQLLHKYQASIYKGLYLLDAWEFNGKHLMYVPQSADWADEYIHHGYILYNQLLRVWALRLVANCLEDEASEAKAREIQQVLSSNFWKTDQHQQLYAPHLQHLLQEAPNNYWLMGFNPTRVYAHFDLQANSLALMLGIGDARQNTSVSQFVENIQKSGPTLIPSFTPSIEAKDRDYLELTQNFAYHFRNFPGEFHNGALWPVWNGFCIAGATAIKNKSLANSILAAMEKLITEDQFEFNECYHGQNQQPIGIKRCTWSAAGYIIGHNSLNNNQLYYGTTL